MKCLFLKPTRVEKNNLCDFRNNWERSIVFRKNLDHDTFHINCLTYVYFKFKYENVGTSPAERTLVKKMLVLN